LKEISKKNRSGEKTGKKQLLDGFKEMRGDWNRRTTHWIALCGELALEEAMELS
jgi:hypothetical protein